METCFIPFVCRAPQPRGAHLPKFVQEIPPSIVLREPLAPWECAAAAVHKSLQEPMSQISPLAHQSRQLDVQYWQRASVDVRQRMTCLPWKGENGKTTLECHLPAATVCMCHPLSLGMKILAMPKKRAANQDNLSRLPVVPRGSPECLLAHMKDPMPDVAADVFGSTTEKTAKNGSV